MGGKASIQGDSYSYGILLLEMFTGKRPTDEVFGEDMNIHQYAKMALPERLMQIVDPTLLLTENLSQMNANIEKCLQSAIEIGLACSVEPPKERMKMAEVISKIRIIKNDLLGAVTNR
ncbi:Tyrosine-protein kinase [Parasponia andersonii]|uniref:Tyrosine-protein kinase n=1 Tax=Parasponia andersonii TaxID=3476 RepID=A0A2P5D4M6_PARAD|nr:Tyrosine-protein kinase [Parasponia andersonii]